MVCLKLACTSCLVAMRMHTHASGRARHAPPCAPTIQTSKRHLLCRMDYIYMYKTRLQGRGGFHFGPGPQPAVTVGPLNSHFATKVHPDRLPLCPRRQNATQGHSGDFPRRSGRLPLPGAAARSKKTTVAPHTFRIDYLRDG
jgi:hypothetical protein